MHTFNTHVIGAFYASIFSIIHVCAFHAVVSTSIDCILYLYVYVELFCVLCFIEGHSVGWLIKLKVQPS